MAQLKKFEDIESLCRRLYSKRARSFNSGSLCQAKTMSRVKNNPFFVILSPKFFKNTFQPVSFWLQSASRSCFYVSLQITRNNPIYQFFSYFRVIFDLKDAFFIKGTGFQYRFLVQIQTKYFSTCVINLEQFGYFCLIRLIKDDMQTKFCIGHAVLEFLIILKD